MKDIRISYKLEKGAKYVAQHNYNYSSWIEIVIRSWCYEEFMKSCSDVVAIWRVKAKS